MSNNVLFRDDSYKHLIFQEQNIIVPGKKLVHVFNKHDMGFLGSIKWFKPWKQYCFFPEPECIFHNECLQKIAEVLTRLNTEGKTK